VLDAVAAVDMHAAADAAAWPAGGATPVLLKQARLFELQAPSEEPVDGEDVQLTRPKPGCGMAMNCGPVGSEGAPRSSRPFSRTDTRSEVCACNVM